MHDRADEVAGKGLPGVWVGDTGVLASDAVAAVARDAMRMAEAFRGGAKALHALPEPLPDTGAARRLVREWPAGAAGTATGPEAESWAGRRPAAVAEIVSLRRAVRRPLRPGRSDS
ncbi:hypothetical protein FRZ03_19795 [Streptomyces misionensis]|uniref:Uncharacterized protein n=1 Tax=Streptomyces misionensis TaxID=67331 RepID=A0A5C6JLL5_9ACTN|nr:hypothetical protein [Streptomyces misionensis]TWV42528.1 hypothetical protein FRZ03_19795 [Streptomyces misionensis]